MSEDEESYCRLCAEITLKSDLISPEDDVAVNSMVVTKMLWINIDVSTSSVLPNAICFSCFDQLERTYRFLNTVRTAQLKLLDIYMKKDEAVEKIDLTQDIGKPVDKDWEDFQETKPGIEDENEECEVQIMTVDANSLRVIGIGNDVKSELESENSFEILNDTDGFKSFDDEDKPLLAVAKKKKSKKKIKFEENSDNLASNVPFPILYMKKGKAAVKIDLAHDIGKPVNKNWENFQETKPDIKGVLDIGNNIKSELESENSFEILNDTDGFKSSEDEDKPLLAVAKKKKSKKKIKFEENSDNSASNVPFPILTWEDYTWRCGNCDALFQNAQSLRLHSVQIHTGCCVFKCNECGKNITNFRMFVKHVRDHKKLLRYCCEFCNKRFNRSAYLKKHYSSHKHDLYLSCENCGSSFETPEELQDHIVLYTKGYKRKSLKDESTGLKCDVCDKEFKSRSNLQQHKLLHTERTRDFSCHVCGKMFFTKGTLSTHIMTHEDVKPYKCEHCSMSFRARGNLQSHISLHSGAKPFVCEQCGKSFRVKRLLKSHYIVHTDLMPFVCQYCNKMFRFKTRLNLHLRQHTGAKPYNCVYCQRDFTNGSNYKKHMKRRHNIDTSKKKFANIGKEINCSDSMEQL